MLPGEKLAKVNFMLDAKGGLNSMLLTAAMDVVKITALHTNVSCVLVVTIILNETNELRCLQREHFYTVPCLPPLTPH